jgi:hypothetical protein
VVASSSHILPGEKGKISVSIHVQGRKGLLLKSVQILSNDPEKSEVTLTVRALLQ